MATVLPAMEGKFGSTNYWIVKMPAKELTERLTIPKNLEGWEELSIEERYQREIDYKRVKQQIAPYLVTDDDRFFGAFIVSVLHAEGIEFEPLGNLISRIPNLYKSAGNSFGFLTLEGDEILVPLDGQHRLAALEFAISGRDERHQSIPGLEANTDVAKDDCTVILIKHEAIKSRKIFNKVNRYAKSTSKAENLITADDDVVAVTVRSKVSDEVIPARLINYRSNTLNVKAPEFTTLATLYEATKAFLEDVVSHRIDTQNLPSAQEQKLMGSQAVDFWKVICENIDLFVQALHDPEEAGDDKRRELRKDFVLCKPFTLLVVVHSIINLRRPNPETGARVSLEETCQRINSLDWSGSHPAWKNVLLNGDRILSGRTAAIFASQVLSFWLGEKLTDDAKAQLSTRYANNNNGAVLTAFDEYAHLSVT